VGIFSLFIYRYIQDNASGETYGEGVHVLRPDRILDKGSILMALPGALRGFIGRAYI